MNDDIEGLSITPVNDNDLLDLAELKALDDSEATQNKVSVERALDKIMSLSNMQMYMTRMNGKPVGYWIGKEEGLDGYRSNGIFTREEFRQMGIGEALKKSQIAYATSRGCKELYSKTRNDHAKRILKSLGFNYNEGEDLYSLPLNCANS